MKKILIIVADSAYFLSHRMQLASFLQQHGYQVSIATDIIDPEHRIVFQNAGFKIHEIPRRPADLGFIYSIRLVHRVKSIIKDVNPDVVLSVSIRMVFLNLMSVAFLYGKKFKFFGMVTGLGFLGTSLSKIYSIIRVSTMIVLKFMCLRRSTYLIVQNADDYKIMSRVINNKRLHKVLGSGVNTQKFYPVDRCCQETVVITMVSRLLKDKGIFEFVEAAHLIKKNRDINCLMQIVGDSYHFNPNSISSQQMLEWVKEGNIVWLGHRDDVVSIYQQSDIAVLPSYREGLPKSLLEAAACGLPLIATDVPGCREICHDSVNGILVPVKDAKSLANAIIYLARSVEKRRDMARASFEKIQSHFSMDIINKSMLDLFNDKTAIEDSTVQYNIERR